MSIPSMRMMHVVSQESDEPTCGLPRRAIDGATRIAAARVDEQDALALPSCPENTRADNSDHLKVFESGLSTEIDTGSGEVHFDRFRSNGKLHGTPSELENSCHVHLATDDG